MVKRRKRGKNVHGGNKLEETEEKKMQWRNCWILSFTTIIWKSSKRKARAERSGHSAFLCRDLSLTQEEKKTFLNCSWSLDINFNRTCIETHSTYIKFPPPTFVNYCTLVLSGFNNAMITMKVDTHALKGTWMQISLSVLCMFALKAWLISHGEHSMTEIWRPQFFGWKVFFKFLPQT